VGSVAEHVQIRALEHFAGSNERPRLEVAVETRDRPGPAYKSGVYSDEAMWVQLKGGLFVARATVRIAWRGEFSKLDEIRRRAGDLPHPESFWSGRPRAGYAVVAQLSDERWIEPFWGGPRTYGYEWVVLEDDRKRASWVDRKEPPRGGESLRDDFLSARSVGFPRSG
jgi:hypothetical protein